jgi:hypothetical protein
VFASNVLDKFCSGYTLAGTAREGANSLVRRQRSRTER